MSILSCVKMSESKWKYCAVSDSRLNWSDFLPRLFRVNYTQDEGSTNAGTFLILKEDHTLGNMLRAYVLSWVWILISSCWMNWWISCWSYWCNLFTVNSFEMNAYCLQDTECPTHLNPKWFWRYTTRIMFEWFIKKLAWSFILCLSCIVEFGSKLILAFSRFAPSDH